MTCTLLVVSFKNQFMKRLKYAFIMLTLIVGFTACDSDKGKYEVDLSDIAKPNIDIHRYGQALFSIDQSDLKANLEKLKPEYSSFLGTEELDVSQVERIRDYIQDPNLVDLYDSTMLKFPNLDKLKQQLADAFRHLEYYYPNEKTPSFYTYISGGSYEEPIMLGNNIVVIGLDNYLGSNFSLYEKMGVPLYVSERMTPAYIVRDVMDAEVKLKQLDDDRVNVVLDEMIRQGKRFAFIQHMIPSLKDEIVFGTTEEKMKWMKENLAFVWGHFIENGILYSHEQHIFRAYVADGPYCKSFGTDSPANVGGYLGWQIINTYIDRHPETPFTKVMNMNADDLLRESRYKP